MKPQAGIDRLDQRITVKVRAAGMFVNGVWQPGAETDYPVWAGYMDKGIGVMVDHDGLRETGKHRFKVRYRQVFVNATPGPDFAVVFEGKRYPVKMIYKDRNERNRFLFLDCEKDE